MGTNGKRSAGLSCVLILLGGVAAACSASSSSAPKQELRVAIGSDLTTFDPVQQQFQYEGSVGRNMFEALTRVKPDLSDVEGAAADRWTVSGDGLTWTFDIRPDERFSDGTQVTASDFVYSYMRILDPRVASANAHPFFDETIAGGQNYGNVNPKNPVAVESFLHGLGLSAPDSRTFIVRMQHPAPYFKWLTSLWIAAPLKASEVEAVGSSKFGVVESNAATAIVGNGPFMLSEVKLGDHMTLVRNPYYRVKAGLQSVVLRVMANSDTVYLAYQNGELDLAFVPLAETTASRRSSDLVLNPELSVYWISFNSQRAPFNNPSVRRAFAEAIDRSAYVRYVLQGRAIASTTLIPKGMNDYRSDLGGSQTFNPAAARAGLAEAGVSAESLNSMGISYLYNGSSSGAKSIAEFVQSQLLTNLGVTITLDGVDGKSASQRERSGDYTIHGLDGWIADYPDPQDFYDFFVSNAGNPSAFANPSFDQVVASADRASNTADRDTLYAQAESILIEQSPVAFMDQPVDWWLVKPYVTGMVRTPIDDFLGDFYMWTIQIAPH